VCYHDVFVLILVCLLLLQITHQYTCQKYNYLFINILHHYFCILMIIFKYLDYI